MRHRISLPTQWFWVLAATGFAVLTVWAFFSFLGNLNGIASFEEEDTLAFFFGSLISLGLMMLFIWLFLRAKTLTYNDRFLYVKGRKGEIQVPLAKIRSVQLVGIIQVLGFSPWAISFYDEDKKEFMVHIFASYPSFHFFCELVKKANPKAKIQNWSLS